MIEKNPTLRHKVFGQKMSHVSLVLQYEKPPIKNEKK